MEYQKIVLNNAHQPRQFDLSKKALNELEKRKGLPENTLSTYDFFADCKRTDPDLISVVEEFGDDANGNARLYIDTFPTNTPYLEILNYDCIETLQVGYPDDIDSGDVDVVLCRNWQYGPFALSDLACREIAKRKNCQTIYSEDFAFGSKFTRYDPDLLHVVKELGDEAGADNVTLYIEHVDKGDIWNICDYDGFEYIKYYDFSMNTKAAKW